MSSSNIQKNIGSKIPILVLRNTTNKNVERNGKNQVENKGGKTARKEVGKCDAKKQEEKARKEGIGEKQVEKKGGKSAINEGGKTDEKKQKEKAGKEVEVLKVGVASLTLTAESAASVESVNGSGEKSEALVPNEKRILVFKTLHDMVNYLPCTELDELDVLKMHMRSESTVDVFVAFVKSFFVDDVKTSIKKMLDNVVAKSVQKQLSWSGIRTKKPSFEKEYKAIVTAMHFALQSQFKDYNYSMFGAKVQALLQGSK